MRRLLLGIALVALIEILILWSVALRG